MKKALWFIANAREFPIAWQWMHKVDFVDKIVVKYMMHHDAHKIAKQYFLEHPEYDYFIISSDDILGTPDLVSSLIADEEEYEYPVVSGWCNVKPGANWAAVSIAPHDGVETKATSYEAYHFLNMADVLLGAYGYPFFKAWFVGLPLTLIRREYAQNLSFGPFMLQKDKHCVTTETRTNGRGIMFDLQFAIDCWHQSVPIMIDTRLFLLHFGIIGDYIRVGREKPVIEFWKAGETTPEILHSPLMDDYGSAELLDSLYTPSSEELPALQTARKAQPVINTQRVFEKWKKFIMENKRADRYWWTGIPFYAWWWGRDDITFLRELPKHINSRNEPEWFK